MKLPDDPKSKFTILKSKFPLVDDFNLNLISNRSDVKFIVDPVFEHTYIDYTGGRGEIKSKFIKCVNLPITQFLCRTPKELQDYYLSSIDDYLIRGAFIHDHQNELINIRNEKINSILNGK